MTVRKIFSPCPTGGPAGNLPFRRRPLSRVIPAPAGLLRDTLVRRASKLELSYHNFTGMQAETGVIIVFLLFSAPAGSCPAGTARGLTAALFVFLLF